MQKWENIYKYDKLRMTNSECRNEFLISFVWVDIFHMENYWLGNQKKNHSKKEIGPLIAEVSY